MQSTLPSIREYKSSRLYAEGFSVIKSFFEHRNKKKELEKMERIYRYLPENVLRVVMKTDSELKKEVCEVRLRAEAPLSFSTYSKNLIVTPEGRISQKTKDAFICTSRDVTQAVNKFCEGSVYRYMSTINSGYIVTPEGVRVGVSGEGIYEKNKIASVSSFSSLNIRLSRDIEGSGDKLSRYVSLHKGASVLILSPPGYGKTTVIRSVAKALSEGKFSSPLRVSLIDERGEILPKGNIGLIDRFLGYSKPDGIEIAVRLFSPEYIICDEIGLSDDTKAILSVQNSGVPFIATAHAKNLSEALLRPNINELIKARVFDTFVRLEKGIEGVETVFEEMKQ